MTIGLLSGGSQQLSKTTSVQGTGTDDSFTFEFPPTGLIWTGTLSCPTAPPGSIFQAVIGGTSWGEWGGNSVFGPVQALSAQQLVVTAQGLTAGVTYVLTWIGSSDPTNVVQPIYPSANSTALTALTSGIPPGLIYGPEPLVSVAGFSGFANIPLASFVRTLSVVVTSNGLTAYDVTNVKVYGDQSGLTYYDQPPYLRTISGIGHLCVMPIASSIDTSVSVVFAFAAGSPHDVYFSLYGDNSTYDESLFYNGVPQRSSSAASVTLTTGPCRILSAFVEVTAAQSCVITVGGLNLLRADGGAAPGTYAITFPQPYIVPLGVIIATSGASVQSGITYAYP